MPGRRYCSQRGHQMSANDLAMKPIITAKDAAAVGLGVADLGEALANGDPTSAPHAQPQPSRRAASRASSKAEGPGSARPVA
jgi:hypothetical protein